MRRRKRPRPYKSSRAFKFKKVFMNITLSWEYYQSRPRPPRKRIKLREVSEFQEPAKFITVFSKMTISSARKLISSSFKRRWKDNSKIYNFVVYIELRLQQQRGEKCDLLRAVQVHAGILFLVIILSLARY